MPERTINFSEIADPEERAWAMIWKVANELQGFSQPDKNAQKIIDKIAGLRLEGKLTGLQKRVLNDMGLIAAVDYDGF